jgi:hypothetical protein
MWGQRRRKQAELKKHTIFSPCSGSFSKEKRLEIPTATESTEAVNISKQSLLLADDHNLQDGLKGCADTYNYLQTVVQKLLNEQNGDMQA